MSSTASTDTSASRDEVSTDSFLLHKPIKVLCSTVDSRLYDRHHNHDNKAFLPESKAHRKKVFQNPEIIELREEKEEEEAIIRAKRDARKLLNSQKRKKDNKKYYAGDEHYHNFDNDDEDDEIFKARDTVYDISALAGFPTNYSLVGRLDYETSGIMLFTKNHELFLEINTPIEYDSDLNQIESSIDISTTIEESDMMDVFAYKKKVYEVKLLAGRELVKKMREEGYTLQHDVLEKQLSEPFTFHRQHVKYYVNEFHQVKVLRIYQDVDLMKGRSDLGWCVNVEVTLLEGKHHQIRRMAKRNHFSVVNLKRVKIAGILSLDSGIEEPGSCRWLTKKEESRIFDGIRRLRDKLHCKQVSSPHKFLHSNEIESNSETIDNENELEQTSFSTCSSKSEDDVQQADFTEELEEIDDGPNYKYLEEEEGEEGSEEETM